MIGITKVNVYGILWLTMTVCHISGPINYQRRRHVAQINEEQTAELTISVPPQTSREPLVEGDKYRQ